MDKSILLIEDDTSLSELYKTAFEKNGYKTILAADTNEAVATLSREKPNLILLDIMLPGQNGLDFLKELKAKEETKNIPVILLTGLAKDPIIKEAFDLGAVGYLIKTHHTPSGVVEEVKNFLKERNKKAGG